MTTELAQQEANQWFELLIPLLKDRKLPCEHGPERICDVDEFMFMGTDNGIGLFKHRDTRNYIHVWPKPEGGHKLIVPRKESFFDKFPEM